MDKQRVVVFIQKGEILPPPSKLAEMARKERGRVKLFTEGLPRTDAHKSKDGSIVIHGLDSPNLRRAQDHLEFIYWLAYLSSLAFARSHPRTKAVIDFLRTEGLGKKELESFRKFMEFVDPSDRRSYALPAVPHIDIDDFLETWQRLNPSLVVATAFIQLKRELCQYTDLFGMMSPLVADLVKSAIDEIIDKRLLQDGFEGGFFVAFPSSELHGSKIPEGHISTLGDFSTFFVPDIIVGGLKKCSRYIDHPILLLHNAVAASLRLEVMEVHCKSTYLLAKRPSFDAAVVLLTEGTARRYDMLGTLQNTNAFDLEVREEKPTAN